MALADERKAIINGVINIEGGFSDDAKDSGGATMLGITEATANQYGYNVRTLTKDQAYTIYERGYWHPILLDNVFELSKKIAAEMFDTGVNTGPARAVGFLQRALNALNSNGQLYPDVTNDGKMGVQTLGALKAYISHRGQKGEETLLNMLNSQQSSFYLELAEKRPKDERFQYGWQANRVDEVETGPIQSFFDPTPEPSPQRQYSVEDVMAGKAPGATFVKPEGASYKPFVRQAESSFRDQTTASLKDAAASVGATLKETAKQEMPPEFYEWQAAQQKAKVIAENTKPARKSKIIQMAIATLVTFLGTKYGLDIPPDLEPLIETVVVGGGLTAITVARRYFTNTFLG